jgi:GNAT superfamily N-acetyltransferase
MIKFEIRLLEQSDILAIVTAFKEIGWNKPTSLFQAYLEEQKANERFVWVAYQQNQFQGYITLKIHSEYMPFAEQNIPEIKDLNVLPDYRNQGIGSALMKRAEDKASAYCTQVGIAVGLTADYGNAQKLYIKNGYIPDGKGMTYQYQSVKWGVNYKVDDDLMLWFIKDLPSKK